MIQFVRSNFYSVCRYVGVNKGDLGARFYGNRTQSAAAGKRGTMIFNAYAGGGVTVKLGLEILQIQCKIQDGGITSVMADGGSQFGREHAKGSQPNRSQPK